MLTFSSLSATVALFAALMVPGFILGKTRRMEERSVSALADLLSDIAMPSLVFVKLLETDVTVLSLFALAVCILLPAAVILLLYGISCRVFPSEKGDCSFCSARFCSVFSNCGFLGIPLAAALFPDIPEVTVYVSLANVVSTFLLLTLGTRILSGGGDRKRTGFFKALFRPVTFAAVLGFLCSALGLGSRFPGAVSYFGILSQLTTPLSMTFLGFELSRVRPKDLFFDKRVYLVAALRLFVSPGIAFVLLGLLKYALGIDVPEPLSSGMLIATAVSTAASASAMARSCGINGGLAACATIVNTFLCVVTLPLLWLVFHAGLA